MTLRVVAPGAPESPFKARVEKIIADMLAQMPEAILIAWEAKGRNVQVRVLPDALIVERGMAEMVWEIASGGGGDE